MALRAGSARNPRVGVRCAVRAVAASLCWLGVAVCAHPQDLTLDSILTLFAQHQHGHVLYTEEVDSPLLERPLHTSGELYFDAPDRLEKRTLQPTPQQLIAEGDQLTLVRGKHHASMRLSDYPQLSPLLNGLRATLAGDRASLEKNFRVALTSGDAGWTINLQPLASEAKPPYKHIEIRGTGGEMRGVTLERTNGEKTVMTLAAPAAS